MWHGYYAGGGWWMLGLGFLFWGSIIALVVWAIHKASGSRAAPLDRGEKRPIDYLNERYARGEISREEYERIRNDISHS